MSKTGIGKLRLVNSLSAAREQVYILNGVRHMKGITFGPRTINVSPLKNIIKTYFRYVKVLSEENKKP